MIEQVLYRRTSEQGYMEYSSRGITEEQAHNVNLVMSKIASELSDLDSGMDNPFMLYPFAEMQKTCIAIFQREFAKGRQNAVNHGILISKEEYRKMIVDPEKIWGFTSKNFISRRVDERNQMASLNELYSSENPELNKDLIFQEYHLKNEGFLNFLSAVYTTLAENRGYTCGIKIDRSKNVNKVARQFGYVLMSMLPYELREKFSFCSRTAPENAGVMIQILTENGENSTDITYDMNSEVCMLKDSSIEIGQFYLTDLLEFSEEELRAYFAKLDEFKKEHEVSESQAESYAFSRVFRLHSHPELFQSVPAKEQLNFVNAVFALNTKQTGFINSFVVNLLPYVDQDHYMEVFDINLGLYQKLDKANEEDHNLLEKLKENLISNYQKGTTEEKAQMFHKVIALNTLSGKFYELFLNFAAVDNIELDNLLIEDYKRLLEKFHSTELGMCILNKLTALFVRYDGESKIALWKCFYEKTEYDAEKLFIDRILQKSDETFCKAVFEDLVELYENEKASSLKETIACCIQTVINSEDDAFRLEVLRKYNDLRKVEIRILWINTYGALTNKGSAAENLDFIDTLEKEYESSSDQKICEMYLDYVSFFTIEKLESLIRKIEQKSKRTKKDDDLIQKIIQTLDRTLKKIDFETLKTLIEIVNKKAINDLVFYIRKYYLEDTPEEESNTIFEYLETQSREIFEHPSMKKEYLLSYDIYCATKIEKNFILDSKKLSEGLRYFEKLNYHNACYEKICSLYERYINQIGSKTSDEERYEMCHSAIQGLDGISETSFGKKHGADLKEKIKEGFWKGSEESSFSYENRKIYLKNSEVFLEAYNDHEKCVLAKTIDRLLSEDLGDWEKVYEALLNPEAESYIKDPKVRKVLKNDIQEKCEGRGVYKKDQEYMAFVCLDLKKKEMDNAGLCTKLLDAGYSIDPERILELKVYTYLDETEEKKLRKIAKQRQKNTEKPRKKTRSDEPYEYDRFEYDNDRSTGSKEKWIIWISQGITLLLLLGINFVRSNALKISENMRLRSLCILASYVGYIIVALGCVAIFMIMLFHSSKKDILRKLVVSAVFTMAAIIFSILFSNLLLDIIMATGFMAIAFILTFVM